MDFIHKKLDMKDVKNAFYVFLGRVPDDERNVFSTAMALMNYQEIQKELVNSEEYSTTDRQNRQTNILLTENIIKLAYAHILFRTPTDNEIYKARENYGNLFELNINLLSSEEYTKRINYLQQHKTSKNVKVILMKSIPRSGHHMLHRLLVEYYKERINYCEFYGNARAGCWKKQPCTCAFDPLLGNKYFLQKSHDFELKDKYEQKNHYIIQYRNPVVTIISDFELRVSENTVEDSKENFLVFFRNALFYRINFLKKWLFNHRDNLLFISYENLLHNTRKEVGRAIQFISGEHPDMEAIEDSMWILAFNADNKNFKPRVPEQFKYYDERLFAEAEIEYLELGRKYNFETRRLFSRSGGPLSLGKPE